MRQTDAGVSSQHGVNHRRDINNSVPGGNPSGDEIGLQTDCFRHGSMVHKTISQWRRNAGISVMNQCLLGRGPFNIGTWLVVSYLKRCKYATTSGARVAFASLKWIGECCDTPQWCQEPMVLAQIKNNFLNGVVSQQVKGVCFLSKWCLPSSNVLAANTEYQ